MKKINNGLLRSHNVPDGALLDSALCKDWRLLIKGTKKDDNLEGFEEFNENTKDPNHEAYCAKLKINPHERKSVRWVDYENNCIDRPRQLNFEEFYQLTGTVADIDQLVGELLDSANNTGINEIVKANHTGNKYWCARDFFQDPFIDRRGWVGG